MKLSEFFENLNDASIGIDELAAHAYKVEDDDEISSAGFAFMKAEDEFLSVLDEKGFELG